MCERVLKEAHGILLQGVRGEGKDPGNYRRGPVWIGSLGAPVGQARYLPIGAGNKLLAAMSRWEKFIHQPFPDRLVPLAILHAEFEAIHPFYDGNGRVGRMFIPLFLWNVRVLRSPMFYISAYLEAHREEYNERLLVISRDGDWLGWCLFFLKALIEQAGENESKARAILQLYETKKKKIQGLVHSQYAIGALDFLFARPIFQAAAFVHESGIPEPSAKRILRILKDNKFFGVISRASGRKSAVFAFRKLLNIAEGKELF